MSTRGALILQAVRIAYMRRRHVPPTRALLVFDAVARHHGVSKAADELCLTHSAVSQQLRQLEEQLGVRLVQRGARGTELTDAGRRYHAQITGDLLRLENHTLEAMAQRPGGTRLLVGALPALAERWLIPRLPQFTQRHPGCSVHLFVFGTHFYLLEPAFDLGIQYDDAIWPGATRKPLMPERCVVVCAPQSRWRAAVAAGDFRDVPQLQLTSRLGAWEDWFNQADIENRPALSLAGHRFDLYSMILEAARIDIGVGLLPEILVQRELREGTLVQAHPFDSQGPRGYSIFFSPHRAGDDPLTEQFADWLVECAAADQAEMPASATSAASGAVSARKIRDPSVALANP